MNLNELDGNSVPRKRLYTITQLLAEIGATDWFWRTQIWQKNLPVIRFGRTQYVDSEDLEIFLEKNKYRN
jgi:hypothetical protein